VMVAVLMAAPSLVMKRPDSQTGHAAPIAASPRPTAPVQEGGRFSLPASPPWIDGAREAPGIDDGGPTLDMRELPSFTAPERTMPRNSR
jgi:hypothetical protein